MCALIVLCSAVRLVMCAFHCYVSNARFFDLHLIVKFVIPALIVLCLNVTLALRSLFVLCLIVRLVMDALFCV